MKRLTAPMLALIIFFVASPALAQEITEKDSSVEMSLGNDLYTAGEVLNITQPLEGDLNAAGDTINISGDVGSDIQAAGSSINITGNIGDDVRIAAGDVLITGDVEGDILVLAGKVTIARSSTISGNLLMAGGTALIEGAINGNAHIRADQVTVTGNVNGDLNIDAEEITIGSLVAGNAVLAAESITLAQAARIEGDLRYWNEDKNLNAIGKVAGTATFDPALSEGRMTDDDYEGIFAGVFGVMMIYSLLYAAFTIGLFMFATRTFFVESAKHMQKAPGWSMLIGLLYFIAMPGVILLLAITLIGLPIALAALAIYLMSIFFAKVLAAIVLARCTELYFKKKWHPVGVFFAALGFYVLLKLLSLIPILGWIIVFFVVVTAYGALATVKYERFQKIR